MEEEIGACDGGHDKEGQARACFGLLDPGLCICVLLLLALVFCMLLLLANDAMLRSSYAWVWKLV